MRWIVAAFCAAAAAYQVLAILASLARRRRLLPTMPFTPTVSILKPVRGADAGLYEAFRSNAAQQYPWFEMLFGVSNPADPAIPLIERLAAEFPCRSIRVLRGAASTPNAKAGKLAEISSQAAGEVLVITDSDIAVPTGYLRDVVAPLSDPSIGLVTCAYRARAESWPARFEALGVSTDFGPSTMVAPFVGIDEFALGSTIVVRKTDLERSGGFQAVADYLADDYQIGRNIHALGLRCVLSHVVVETHLAGVRWRDVWNHQVRWARTIRVSRGGGYVGLPITHATLWAAAAAITGMWLVAAGLMIIRYAMAFIAGWLVLGSRDVPRLWWLIPFRDLWATAVWAAGLMGETVEWGGERLRVTADGKIVR